VTFVTGKVDAVSHSKSSSTVTLQDSDMQLTGTLVLDATGHSRRLVQFDKEFDPGYQGAYGIIAGGEGGTGRQLL
jgi:lycopene beta-cyclase